MCVGGVALSSNLLYPSPPSSVPFPTVIHIRNATQRDCIVCPPIYLNQRIQTPIKPSIKIRGTVGPIDQTKKNPPFFCFVFVFITFLLRILFFLRILSIWHM